MHEAEKALKEAQRPLLTLEKNSDLFGPSVRVYHDRIEAPKHRHRLTADLSARVEGSGRQVYVIIECPEWGYTNDSYDSGKQAHDFARDFNRLISQLPLPVPRAITNAQQNLASAKQALAASIEVNARSGDDMSTP